MRNKTLIYEEPVVELIQVNVENGFAVSGETTNGQIDGWAPGEDW